MKKLMSVMMIAGLAAPLLADLVTPVRLFGERYRVDRFDYSVEVTWPNVLAPGFDAQLIEVEGAHFLSGNNFLLSYDEGDALLIPAPKNAIVEVRIDYASGAPAGLSYVRTVVERDFNSIDPNDYDLDPTGLTINTGATGIGAGGNLLASDAENEDGTLNQVRGFDLATGAQLEWAPGSGCLSSSDGKFCGFTVDPVNTNIEDVEYIPTRDRIFTLEDNTYEIEVFSTAGVHQPAESFPVGQAIGTPNVGEGKGLVYVADVAAYPTPIRAADGSIMVTLDDQGPALQVFDLDGNEIALQYLNTGLALDTLQLGVCGNPLQIESAATDPATGRFILVMQGDFLDCNLLYVLSPTCRGDVNGDGQVSQDDLNLLLAAFGTLSGQAGYNLLADLDESGAVNQDDLNLLLADFGQNCL